MRIDFVLYHITPNFFFLRILIILIYTREKGKDFKEIYNDVYTKRV